MTRGTHSFFTFLLCILLDWLWITEWSGDLLNYRVRNWMQPADTLFYCILAACLLMYSVYPALYIRHRLMAVVNGAKTGFALFGLYEVISSFWYINYPTSLAVADTVWGVFAGALLGLISFEMGRWMRLTGSAEKDVELDQDMFLE